MPRPAGRHASIPTAPTTSSMAFATQPTEAPNVAEMGALKLQEPKAKLRPVDEAGADHEHADAKDVKPGHTLLPGGIEPSKVEQLEKWFIGSIDQGTTSSRFLIFDGTGTPVASHQIEFENMYPQSG